MYKTGICYSVIFALSAIGCNGGGSSGAAKLDTHKVMGKVTMNGAPVPGATVTFSPVENGKPPALGLTDTQGSYVLTTYDSGDGAVAGEYKVLVYKSAPSEASSAPTHDATGAGGASAPQHSGPKGAQKDGGSLLPAKYSAASTTTITKSVKDGDNTLDIEL